MVKTRLFCSAFVPEASGALDARWIYFSSVDEIYKCMFLRYFLRATSVYGWHPPTTHIHSQPVNKTNLFLLGILDTSRHALVGSTQGTHVEQELALLSLLPSSATTVCCRHDRCYFTAEDFESMFSVVTLHYYQSPTAVEIILYVISLSAKVTYFPLCLKRVEQRIKPFALARFPIIILPRGAPSPLRIRRASSFLYAHGSNFLLRTECGANLHWRRAMALCAPIRVGLFSKERKLFVGPN